MIRAAGILIVSKQGRALFLKRGPGSDFPGMWCIPGGRMEEGEDCVTAAVRETLEEAGYKTDPSKLVYWTRRISPQQTTGALPTPAPIDANAGPRAPLEVIKEMAQPLPDAVIPPGAEQVEFTTYLLAGVEEFTPDIDKSGEHVGFTWAPIDQPPEPLHPGCRVALQRFTMNELGIADAMIAGELTSPQKYGGFWLFDIRITGTGVAYRSRQLGEMATTKDRKAGKKVDRSGLLIEKDEEYTYRNPQDYMSDEFLQRCNGLLVVLEHPAAEVLQVGHDDFEKRTIGTVFKPYMRPTAKEVWGIAKIYNEDAAELMATNQLSTSPGVVWRNFNTANVKTVIDGHNFLLEGKPSLMDHIAVCRQGVWDKGGRPSGVNTTEARKDSVNIMTKEELEAMLRAHREESDTAIKTALGAIEKVAGAVGTIQSRFDAEDENKEKMAKDSARKDADDFEFSKKKDDESDEDYKERHDAEEMALCDMMQKAGDAKDDAKEKAAKDRKDSEEGEAKDRKDAEDEKEAAKDRKDAAALSVENVALKKRLDDLEATIGQRLPEKSPMAIDPAKFAAVQTRFDDAFAALGLNTPRPMPHESLLAYRKRGIVDLAKYSKTWKKANLNVAALDEATFDPIHDQVLVEATAEARSDASVPPGTLREVTKTLATGHKETTFFGNPADWMADFAPSQRYAAIQKHNANGQK